MKHPRSQCAIGPLGNSQRVVAKHYVPQRHDFAVPERITNSSSTAPYVPDDRTVYRPGSQVRHPSRGF